MERLRVARAGLVIGWILVSMLVVAGFAAFSAQDPELGLQTADRSPAVGDLGRNAGAVSGLAFAATAPSTSATATTVDIDPEVERSLLAAASETTQTTEAADRDGTVFVRSGYLDETEVRGLVTEFFLSEDVNKAIRVAWCASSFNPAAVNPATGGSGLFQHLPEHWAERSAAVGHPGASIFDPEANVAVAAWMLYELPGGWSHWNCTP